MTTYRVNGTVTVSATTVVEADSPEQAKQIANDRQLAGLCHMPFDADEDETWHLETDGVPEVIDVDEED